jgi:hypothetical protein
MRAWTALILMTLATCAAGRLVLAAEETPPAGEAEQEATAADTEDSAGSDEADDKPLTIDDIMRYAMTQHLCKKVAKKQATPKEQRRLVELFQALAKLQPPKGSQESWDKKTAALVTAAEAVVAGKPSHQALMKAANCAACHKAHRP